MSRANDKPYRRRGRPGWWVTYYDEAGKRRRVLGGDGKGGRDNAVILRQRLIEQVALIRGGLTTRKAADAADARQTTIVDALAAWAADPKIARKSDGHRSQVRVTVLRTGAHTLAGLTPKFVRGWLDEQLDDRAGEDIAPATYNSYLGSIRTFCRWCVRQGWLLECPTTGIDSLNADEDRRALPRAMTLGELTDLVAAIKPVRALRYLFGARQGLRQREIDRLCWRHIDLDGGWIRLEAGKTKSRRGDELPLDPEVRSRLLTLRPVDAKPSDLILPPLDPRTWIRDLIRAGIVRLDGNQPEQRPDRLGRRRRLSLRSPGVKLVGYADDRGRLLHLGCLRHTYGTHLAMTTDRVADVAKLMRHTDPKITLKLYTDARLLDLRGTQGRLPAVGASAVPDNAHPTTPNRPQSLPTLKRGTA